MPEIDEASSGICWSVGEQPPEAVDVFSVEARFEVVLGELGVGVVSENASIPTTADTFGMKAASFSPSAPSASVAQQSTV
jgi:hypothetical protein